MRVSNWNAPEVEVVVNRSTEVRAAWMLHEINFKHARQNSRTHSNVRSEQTALLHS